MVVEIDFREPVVFIDQTCGMAGMKLGGVIDPVRLNSFDYRTNYLRIESTALAYQGRIPSPQTSAKIVRSMVFLRYALS